MMSDFYLAFGHFSLELERCPHRRRHRHKSPARWGCYASRDCYAGECLLPLGQTLALGNLLHRLLRARKAMGLVICSGGRDDGNAIWKLLYYRHTALIGTLMVELLKRLVGVYPPWGTTWTITRQCMVYKRFIETTTFKTKGTLNFRLITFTTR